MAEKGLTTKDSHLIEMEEAYNAIWRDLYLTPPERRFCEEFVAYGSPSKAMMAALDLDPETLSPQDKTRQSNKGQALLRNRDIQTAIARLQAYHSAKEGLYTERILHKSKVEAFFDPLEVYTNTETWELRPLDEWPLEIRQCIKRVRTRRTRRTHKDGSIEMLTETEVEWTDRQEAIRLLGQHLGLWEKKRGGGGYTLIIGKQDTEAPPPVPLLPAAMNGTLQGPGGLVIDLEAFRSE